MITVEKMSTLPRTDQEAPDLSHRKAVEKSKAIVKAKFASKRNWFNNENKRMKKEDKQGDVNYGDIPGQTYGCP
tara:strand:- start:129 stop:350 length:222 start_codon:yes stop_codon:yes gene_type:complete